MIDYQHPILQEMRRHYNFSQESLIKADEAARSWRSHEEKKELFLDASFQLMCADLEIVRLTDIIENSCLLEEDKIKYILYFDDYRQRVVKLNEESLEKLNFYTSLRKQLEK